MSFENEHKIILFPRQKGEAFKLYYDKGYFILNGNPSTEEEYNAWLSEQAEYLQGDDEDW